MTKAKGAPKTGGRRKGTPNKVSGTVREWLANVIDKNRKQVERDIKTLKPKERLQMLEKLMQYVVPKQQAISAKVDFNQLTDEQLNMLVGEITKGVDDEYLYE